jgi:hypothetical protein
MKHLIRTFLTHNKSYVKSHERVSRCFSRVVFMMEMKIVGKEIVREILVLAAALSLY